MAVPSVPTPDLTKVYSDLTTARLVRDSDIKLSGSYSIKTDGVNDNGYSVYGLGVLPDTLTEPFVRIRCLMEAHPGEFALTEIGVITNYDPVTQTGSFYSLEFTQLVGTKSIKFKAGTVDISGPSVNPTEVDSETEIDTAAWMIGEPNWAYMDVHIGESFSAIYLYDSTGTLKYQKTLTKQPTGSGTVGIFFRDTTGGLSSKPHVDEFYVDNDSPYT